MSLSRFFLRRAALRFGLLAAFTMVAITAPLSFAQTELATVLGRITDQSGAVISGVEVEIRNVGTNSAVIATSNSDGLYSIPSLHPGEYVISVRKAGFRTVSATGLELNVQDNVIRNFVLQVGSTSESITVSAEAGKIDTTDATVSTVVDRNFAENLPMNGRSFQTLIQLTPGVVVTASNAGDQGQFSVNGQRAASNYWMLDGVGANIGVGVSSHDTTGNALAGASGSFSALGGTNSLVSVDAMQEFRIQTSTYAPEFGRVPGAQISIVTRSGTNQFHGSVFDYLRNDALDANNWFNGFTNNPPLQKAKERQNDFGGTLNGPIWKDRTFFFFSYEGLRLQLPQTTLTTVPDLLSRQSALPALQPFLNAFSLPNGPPAVDSQGNPIPGAANFNASYSNPALLDAYSLRLDHTLNKRLMLFGRYNYSPSEIEQRGSAGSPLSIIAATTIRVQTGTLGTTWTPSSLVVDDFRANYSQTNASADRRFDGFGGAMPLDALPFPAPFNSKNGHFFMDIFPLQGGTLEVGKQGHNVQQQVNLVDSVAVQRGSHSFKFGVDYRRLSPLNSRYSYQQLADFLSVPDAEEGQLLVSAVYSNVDLTFLFRNLGLYAQDTWRIVPRLTLTYGIRWDIDFTPRSLHGPALPAVTGFTHGDLSNLALAPLGTPAYRTTYGNVAPRLGVAYQLSQNPAWQTVLRGGFGLFYDLASSEVGNNIGSGAYPFGSFVLNIGGTFPLAPAAATPAPIAPPSTDAPAILAGFDPHLVLPYTLEWNVAMEQALGREQTLSASYIGASGRRLLQTVQGDPGPAFVQAQIVANLGSSSYDALQLQFQRRLSHGLQALASYTWSHSIDTGSAGSVFSGSNGPIASAVELSRGPSDFDIRHTFSAGLTYVVQTSQANAFARAVLRDWSIDNIIQARSAPPVDIEDGNNLFGFNNGNFATIRPDLVSGQPLYLRGAEFPGGRAFNPAAFTDPPVDPNTGNPLRQGDVPRNLLRGFGAAQWDFAVHREFRLHEAWRLQFRAEMFNVLNHPNFGQPGEQFGVGGFGVSSQMLGQYLNGAGGSSNLGSGGFSPLYQFGGPRSIQLAMKFMF
jgi:hypothetical protein